jgi:epoxyqueuosine reductase
MSEGAANTPRIKEEALRLGFDLVGVADVRRVRDGIALAPALRGSLDYAISLGKRLSDAVLEDIVDHPTPIYFHHYRQTNFFLDRGAFLLADWIQRSGASALALPASQILDWGKQTAHLSHKHVGVLAGLGWFGRNNLLVNLDLGARFRLVTIVTDMTLESSVPVHDGCGTCRACLGVCPASAIKETREEFDHLACYEKLREFRKLGTTSQFICGVCVKACRGPRG